MKFKKIEIALVIGLVASVMFSSFTAFARQCDDISNSVVRLHILANSDSEEDQAIKLEVRDAILANAAEIFESSQNREEALEKLTSNMEKVKDITAQTLAEYGDITFKVEVTNMYFSTRHYDGFDLPAGRYDALRVTIGEGAGQNWWCMMYPPMCITAATEHVGEDVMEEILNLGQTPVYEPKLAVVEFINSLKEVAAEK